MTRTYPSPSKVAVVFILADLDAGGAQKTTVLLANWLNQVTNFDVTLLVISTSERSVHSVGDDLNLISLNRRRAISSIPMLRKTIRDLQPHFVMPAQNYVNLITLWSLSLMKVRPKVIFWQKNIFNPPRKTIRSIVEMFADFWVRRSYRLANKLVVNSPETLESLKNNGVRLPEETLVLANPVETPPLPESPLSAPPISPPYIIAVGRLVEQKGFDLLIEAFAMLSSPSLQLVIVGAGEKHVALESQAKALGIEESVHFLGHVDSPAEIIRGARLFVLSSRWEGFGNVLVEALQVGTPIVSFDCPGGPRWILDSGKYGRLVRPLTPSALMQGIDAALRESPNVRELVRRGNEFRIDQIGPKFIARVFV